VLLQAEKLACAASGLAAQILHPLEHAWHEFPEFIVSRRNDDELGYCDEPRQSESLISQQRLVR
jgi:hypothetical protein